TYVSAPWGDEYSANEISSQGDGQDNLHFAGLDHDAESNTDHAMFRQYSPTQGRWMSPDPYTGSYDFSDPQSLNRYAYVGNSPLGATDPTGLDGEVGGAGGCVGAVVFLGGNVGADANCAFGFLIHWLSGGPKFKGSLQPRPSNGNWDEQGAYYHSPYSSIASMIGDVGGLSTPGCEFGSCGSSFLNQTPIKENKTLQQKIAELAAAGVFVGPFETKYSPFHKGQITLRDNNWFCSQHVALDQGSGSGGHPVTGEYHYDLVNPWKLTPVTTYWHTLLDLVPDKIQDRFPSFPTGSDLCK
ncbi:MAG: RHS repeat-associated core domain-containing protein, partial [Acidobacteriales bacterium]|nr:RHS repeat-associated core domain-containing protein [Terriglobales bacterium]